MKLRFALAMALILGGLVSTSQGASVLYNATGGGATGALLVDNFLNSTGDADAVGGQTLAAAGTAGTIQLVFQTYLSNLQFGGATIPGNPIGSATAFASVVASFPEFQSAPSSATLPSTVNFSTGSGAINFFRIYQVPATPNLATGAGFTSALLEAQGVITSDNGSFTAQSVGTIGGNGAGNPNGQSPSTPSVNGNGSTQVTVSFTGPGTSVNPAYFPNGIPNLVFQFNTQNLLPFDASTPASSAFFDGTVPSIAGGNGLDGSGDVELDIHSNFVPASAAVPEPASLTLLLVGACGGLFGMIRRRQSA